jgi:hypothetical protein
MTYTGDVSVGGAADTRELPGLTITKVAVGPMDNNAYLLRCTQTGALALIDAAAEPQTLLGLIGDVPLATIITTHAAQTPCLAGAARPIVGVGERRNTGPPPRGRSVAPSEPEAAAQVDRPGRTRGVVPATAETNSSN